MNFSALDSVPSQHTIDAYKALHPEQQQYVHGDGEYLLTKKAKRNAIFASAFGVVVMLISIIYGFVVTSATVSNTQNGSVAFALSIFIVVFIIGFLVIQFRGVAKLQKQTAWRTATQLDQFARDNGYELIRDKVFHPQGMLDRQLKEATYFKTNAILTPQYEIGTIATRVSSDNRENTTSGYLRIPLAAHLPNMVLTAKIKTTLPNLLGDSSSEYNRNDLVELEGDFNKYFTLVVPKGYQEEARYFFTPDLMSLLIDNDKGHDVEIIDDSLYVYLTVNWFDHKLWEQAQQIYETIGKKVEARAELYGNTNAAEAYLMATQTPGQQPGKRLVRNKPLIATIFAGVILINYGIQGWNAFSHAGQLLSHPNSVALNDAEVSNALAVSKSWLLAVQYRDFDAAMKLEDPGLIESYSKEKQQKELPAFVPQNSSFTMSDKAVGVRTRDNADVVSVVYEFDSYQPTFIRLNVWYHEGKWQLWGESYSTDTLLPDINLSA